MNVKRFTARTSRDALSLVRQALGDDAVVLSTKPSATGVEVLAMAPESLRQVERLNSATAPAPSPTTSTASTKAAARPPASAADALSRAEPALENSTAGEDADRLAMSTLSFQDYVRERMLRRRQAALKSEPRAEAEGEAFAPTSRFGGLITGSTERTIEAPIAAEPRAPEHGVASTPARRLHPAMRDVPLLHDTLLPTSEIRVPGIATTSTVARADADDMLKELRAMKGLIEERFGALAFMEKLQRQPGQARLTQKLLDLSLIHI